VQAGVVLGVLGLGLAVPNAPGYFGTFQISGYSALVLFYPLAVVMSAGAAFLFLLYVIQMTLTLLAAAPALLWMNRLNRLNRMNQMDRSSGNQLSDLSEMSQRGRAAHAPARSPEAK
jgi:hypothetical protein